MRTPRPDRPGASATKSRAAGVRSSADGELLFGRNAVLEALRAGRRPVRRLLLAAGIERDERVEEIAQRVRAAGARTLELPRNELDARCPGHHQGVALESGSYRYADAPELTQLSADDTCILALDGIVDPQNTGTLLRTADATGFEHVVIPLNRAAGITPAVVHASAGAVEHLTVWREVNLVRWLDRAKAAGIFVVGLAVRPGATPLFEVDLQPPLILTIGAEGSGLRRLTREACDLLVEIPMFGRVDSLNASVAGALAMYEVRRWIETEPERSTQQGA